ncbi:MAG: undecaprenyldiphospho-muramoylpentapeptide beta-N-acetylglucosaminyltransferase [Bacteroidales bacterium]|jgi:UDP-N-acetylglucosamine--N-acetylmuramyl-(pentapeptide) pyrophosphoryl-undecaprenol N-acetylglucosamine transferase|nr:undecaprenyldiphospho-muramoylpentapeptide beta-N-acetylglucosaminyltransferase [Bacteroidales bacterium]
MKIIISGGGTGGHIFPAIAIANAIKAKYPNADILFVGANGRMEMEKVPAAGYRIEGLDIAGIQRTLTLRNILKNLMLPFKILKSNRRAKQIIQQFNPDVVIGVGGYASFPTLNMASKLKIPCLIQEQNSYPGVVNKRLKNKVQKICIAYDDVRKYFPSEKIVFTGNPIRQDISDLNHKRDEAAIYFNVDSTKKTLLVIGGSLGARTINESLLAMLPELAQTDLQVIWQTGKNFDISAVDTQKHPNIHIMPFITRMDLAYSIADFIVSRAGALSISELCMVGKPAILIPSPNVSEDHQTKNAMALVNQNAALFVADKDAKTALFSTISDLLNNAELQVNLSQNISKLAKTDAAKQIADIVDSIKKS